MAPSTPFFQLFGRSPIRPMQEHMEKVYECTELLAPFFDAVFSKDWQKAEDLQKKIANLESKADELKHDIRQHLPHGFFLPAPRIDLLQMLSLQDKIANKAKDIAGLVIGRAMNFPDALRQTYKELLTKCIATCEQAAKAIYELDALLETGFRGQEADFVGNILIEIDKVEQDSDEMQIKVRRELFKMERDYSPIDVMFLYQVIEATGDLADRAQKLGGQLEIIIAR